jgi:hypothetical protein
LLVAAVPSYAENVVYNGDFEQGTSDLRGWTVSVGTTAYSAMSGGPSESGNAAEGIEPEAIGNLGRLLHEVNARVIPGETYRLTGWIKTENVQTSGGVSIGVGTLNQDGAFVEGSFEEIIGSVTETTDWTPYDSGNFVLLDHSGSNTVSIAIFFDFIGNGPGTAFFDDIVLEGPLATPLDPLYVDFAHTGVRRGTEALPIVRVVEAAHSVAEGGDVLLQPGTSPETLVISRPLRLVNANPEGGAVVIGGAIQPLVKARTGFVSGSKRSGTVRIIRH